MQAAAHRAQGSFSSGYDNWNRTAFHHFSEILAVVGFDEACSKFRGDAAGEVSAR
jgi:hypothetical protein